MTTKKKQNTPTSLAFERGKKEGYAAGRIDGIDEGLARGRSEFLPNWQRRDHINRYIAAIKNAGVGPEAATATYITDLKQQAIAAAGIHVLWAICDELGRLGYGK